MKTTGSFFSHKSAPMPRVPKREMERSAIPVAGVFHAAAASFIDYMYSHSAYDELSMKKLLNAYNHYFPKSVANDPYLTLKERWGRLLHTPRKSEVVESMAHVFHQLTVDELYANPTDLSYREVFARLKPTSSKNELRQEMHYFDANIVPTIAHILKLPISVSFTQPERDLRKREGYIGTKPALMIQVQGDEFYALVKHKSYFAYVGKLAVVVKHDTIEQEGTMADLLDVIKGENERLIRSFKQQRHSFLSMVAAGDMTLDELQEMYIKFLPSQTKDASFVQQLYHKSQHEIAGLPPTLKQIKVDLLVNALASWIIVDAVKADQLFAELETPSTRVIAR